VAQRTGPASRRDLPRSPSLQGWLCCQPLLRAAWLAFSAWLAVGTSHPKTASTETPEVLSVTIHQNPCEASDIIERCEIARESWNLREPFTEGEPLTQLLDGSVLVRRL
jgi:hypothetical protein